MYSTITTDVAEAVRIIHAGRIVAFPTGTSYGLAVDALQGHALQRLRNLKQRPHGKTFTVFVRQALWEVYLDLTEQEQAFLKRYEGKPVTLLVQPKQNLQHLEHEGAVGVRVIDHPLMDRLAEAVDVPLTATSANISGQEPCYDPECIVEQFPGKLDAVSPELRRAGATTYDLSLGCVFDGGKLKAGRVSTIVRFKDDQLNIVRPGALAL